MRLSYHRGAVVEERVGVGAEEHRESRTCAALPRVTPFTDHVAVAVPSSAHA